MREESVVRTVMGVRSSALVSSIVCSSSRRDVNACKISGFKEASVMFCSSVRIHIVVWQAEGVQGGAFVAIATQQYSPWWESYPHLYWHSRHGVLGHHYILACNCSQRRPSHAEINLLGTHRTWVSGWQSPKSVRPTTGNHSAGGLVAWDLPSWRIAWW